MNIVILDAGTLGKDLDLSVFSQFGNLSVYDSTAADEIKNRTANADVIIVNKIKCNEKTLGPDSSVKLITVAATGYDNIDTDFCRSHGIAVCNVPSYSANSVSQLTAAMVFALSVNLTEYREYVASGKYTGNGVANSITPVYHELFGKTWGVVGFGSIGKKVAMIAEAVGCNVKICRSSNTGDSRETDIDDICRNCDIITLHTPLTEKTKNLISADRIKTMKKSVILVNAARGAVIDETAITDAVINGSVSGFATDVYTSEPFSLEHPYNKIMNYPNVIMTPHMAWGSYESRIRCINTMVENIKAFTKNERLNRIV